MAEKLASFPKPERHGPSEMYPWDEWLDGSIWKLVRGDDFTTKTKSFQYQVYAKAARRDVNVRVSVRDGNTLVIQAYRMAAPLKRVLRAAAA
jgi:hypothetical protein